MLPYIKIVAHIFPLFFLGPQLLKIHICKKKIALCYFPFKYSSRKLAWVSLVLTSI